MVVARAECPVIFFAFSMNLVGSVDFPISAKGSGRDPSKTYHKHSACLQVTDLKTVKHVEAQGGPVIDTLQSTSLFQRRRLSVVGCPAFMPSPVSGQSATSNSKRSQDFIAIRYGFSRTHDTQLLAPPCLPVSGWLGDWCHGEAFGFVSFPV